MATSTLGQIGGRNRNSSCEGDGRRNPGGNVLAIVFSDANFNIVLPQARNELTRMEEELNVHLEPICMRFRSPAQLQLALYNLSEMDSEIEIFQVDFESTVDKFRIKSKRQKTCGAVNKVKVKRGINDFESISSSPPPPPPMFIYVSPDKVQS
jgi:hypothetical protein